MKNGVVGKFIINYFLYWLFLLNSKLEEMILSCKQISIKACSSVDRASDSDSECQGFDSLHAYIEIVMKIK